MDPYQDLLNTARETAEMLASRTSPTEYKNDEGVTVQGWAIESKVENEEKEIGNREWRERTITTTTLLATDGKIYFHSRHLLEETSKEARTFLTLREMQANGLVGSRGKPFSEIKGKLERLPWTA